MIVDDQVSYAEAIGLALSLTPDLESVGRAHDICLLYTSDAADE